MLVYLDSSAIAKRYVEEKGSDVLDILYGALEEGNADYRIVFSSWNLGEVLGVLDQRHQKGDLSEKEMSEARGLFIGETKKFVAMRKVNLLPVGRKYLSSARELIVKHHIYQADALQISSAKQADAGLFVSADKKLVECAKIEQIGTVANPEKDRIKVADLLALESSK